MKPIAAPTPIPMANMPIMVWILPSRISTPAMAAASSSTAATEMSMEPISSTHSIPEAITRFMEQFLSMFM